MPVPLAASVYLRWPAALGAAAMVALVAVGGVHPLPVIAGSLLVAAGLSIGRHLAAQHEAVRAALQRDAERRLARISDLCSASVPVWQRQVESVREQGDGEVAQLTRRFGEIARRLDEVMARLPGAADGGEDAVMGTLARAGADLDALVASLQEVQASKQRIVGEIGAESARLKEHAAEIRQIALHTRMVAMNATIEAARAGAAGKPFAVIVNDMRELAARTAGASEQFSLHTDRLHGMVAAAFEEQAGAQASDGSIAWAQDLVRQVTGRFAEVVRQLSHSLDVMRAERGEVRNEIAHVLVALQFQDRVSQILAHVAANLQELDDVLHAPEGPPIDTRAWIERMSVAYSTAEEFDNLQPLARHAPQPAAEVTYF